MSDKYKTVREFVEEHARLELALSKLVEALDSTSWSS